jgi:hypothetical protein
MPPSSSEEEDEDVQWDSWEDDEFDGGPVKSLFDDSTFANVQLALNYDTETHHFNLREFCAVVYSLLPVNDPTAPLLIVELSCLLNFKTHSSIQKFLT